jgi:hypothetical protein
MSKRIMIDDPSLDDPIHSYPCRSRATGKFCSSTDPFALPTVEWAKYEEHIRWCAFEEDGWSLEDAKKYAANVLDVNRPNFDEFKRGRRAREIEALVNVISQVRQAREHETLEPREARRIEGQNRARALGYRIEVQPGRAS